LAEIFLARHLKKSKSFMFFVAAEFLYFLAVLMLSLITG
jgi:hypothetical protein